MTKLYVGNLPWAIDDEALLGLFSQHGDVASASVVRDRETGRSRGFGFVEFSNEGEANTAIEALNGLAYEGRNLTVNVARPREPRSGGGGGGGRGGYGGGRGGGGGGGGRGGW